MPQTWWIFSTRPRCARIRAYISARTGSPEDSGATPRREMGSSDFVMSFSREWLLDLRVAVEGGGNALLLRETPMGAIASAHGQSLEGCHAEFISMQEQAAVARSCGRWPHSQAVPWMVGTPAQERGFATYMIRLTLVGTFTP